MSESLHPFPLNCWYALGWAHEVTADVILARRVADVALIAFRDADGAVTALEDRCCHRQAPLSSGRLEGDGIRCGYHGMKFAPDGACIEVPGQKHVPSTFKVQSYPTIEHHDVVLVWLGDQPPEPASALPDFYWHGSDEWSMRPSHIHVKANYQLIIDNILDFSHLTWLHGASFGTASAASTIGEVTKMPGGVQVRYFYPNTPITPFHTRLSGYDGPVDREHVITWQAPAMEHTAARFWPVGKSDERPLLEFRTSHFLSPETETTTNYFWTHANRADIASDEQMDLTYDVVSRAFAEEDRPIIEAQQRNINVDRPMRPAVWDEALTIARREIARLVAADQAAAD